MKKVLIIDDRQSFGELVNFLSEKDYSPTNVATVGKGLENLKKSEDLKVVLLNVESSGERGLQALARIKKDHPKVIVIIIGAGGQVARKAMPLGAFDVLFISSADMNDADMEDVDKGRIRADKEHLCEVLDGVFKRLSIRSSSDGDPSSDDDPSSDGDPSSDDDPTEDKKSLKLVGEHRAMLEVSKAIGRVARNKISVLIEGETGTGKGLVARLIHEESRRKGKFITVDCGAIPELLVEGELFGHKKGAFTDAKEDKKGKFEEANGGTLFLDEVGNLPPNSQVKLLDVLQRGVVTPLGDNKERKVDVRVISATNQKLEEMVEEGKFRQDLFYRLCGYKISLPPLRERREDISLLGTSFLQRIEEDNNHRTYGISEEVLQLFHEYNWPGNVRELENCLESATANSRGEVILLDDLPPNIQRYRDDRSSEGDGGNASVRIHVAPVYGNLFDLPVTVFCQFISDTRSGVTDNQITKWWEEFSNYGKDRADRAKRTIDNWRVEWNTTWFALPDLSERIKAAVDDAVAQLSNRHRIGSEAEPVSIKGRTLRGILTAVLIQTVKAHGGNREKAAEELEMPVQQLEKRLSYIVTEYEGDREKAAEELEMPVQQLEEWLSNWTEDDRDDRKNALRTPIEPSRALKQFPGEDIRRLLTRSVRSFLLECFSHIEWREKGLASQIRAVHLALKVLSKRLDGEHNYIYFGGMTFSQIERNIYRRVPYLYKSPKEAADALNVDMRTFRHYWPEDKPFPSHDTLFVG